MAKKVKSVKAWGLLNLKTGRLCVWVFPVKRIPVWVEGKGDEYKAIRVSIREEPSKGRGK